MIVPGVLAVLALAVALSAPAAEAAAPAPDQCLACHLQAADARLAAPAREFADDIHRVKGFGCAACHGGDPREPGKAGMDPRKGYIGKPKRETIPQLCGRCHSNAGFMKQYNPALRVDQAAEYATSVHGQRLREAGDAKVATCASCHPAHTIRPPSDPKSSVHPARVAETCGRCHADAAYMAGYKIPTDQLQKYKTSVHWQAMSAKGDLSAPTCNDCHGNHGAVPPGVSWVGNVCGQCHTVMADLFKKSVHDKVFTEMGTPGCATCHENHAIKAAADEMLGVGDKSVCASCHGADDKGGKTATEMRARIDALRGAHERARAILLRAEHAGMEVSQATFDLNAAGDALVKARAAVHAFSADAVTKEVEPGLQVSAKAFARGERALEELAFRRKGLAVSVVVILALIVGLVLKIREVDRRQEGRHG
jgi:predicted CXXCH cytochrome family protein